TSVLHAVELVALGYRQQHRMAFGATLEGIAPFWLRAALRADLANRTGVDTLAVSDAQIDAHFAARGIRLQFVYNWQPLTIAAGTGTGPGGEGTGFGIATDYPATVSLLLYPAGTFVRGHGDIISLETVYDSTLLSTNMYTALFAEQDLL